MLSLSHFLDSLFTTKYRLTLHKGMKGEGNSERSMYCSHGRVSLKGLSQFLSRSL